jgi:peroxiredoxin
LCNSELRSFEQHLNEFRARGVEIAAISIDSNQESRTLCASQGYTFPFLSDPKAEVIRRYGVLHPHAGEEGGDIARPAEFLVDAAGTIRWENLTKNIRVRARPEAVLKALDDLLPPRASLEIKLASRALDF